MSRANVTSVYIRDWVVEGEFHEDTQYFDTILFVCAELEDGRTLVHNVSFNDSGTALRWSQDGVEEAERLASRVEARGWIDEDHWYFHEFFSRTLQDRLNIEAQYEDYARKGIEAPSNVWFEGGHA